MAEEVPTGRVFMDQLEVDLLREVDEVPVPSIIVTGLFQAELLVVAPLLGLVVVFIHG